MLGWTLASPLAPSGELMFPTPQAQGHLYSWASLLTDLGPCRSCAAMADAEFSTLLSLWSEAGFWLLSALYHWVWSRGIHGNLVLGVKSWLAHLTSGLNLCCLTSCLAATELIFDGPFVQLPLLS